MNLPGHRRGRRALLLAGALASVSPLPAQVTGSASGPAALPRPGYDPPPPLHVGATQIRLEYDMSALYDSNVYATRTAPQDDAVVRATLRAGVTREQARASITGDTYITRRQHISIDRESATLFGAQLRTQMTLAGNQQIAATAQYDRGVESRSDPEARASILLRPRKIDIFGGEASYAIDGRFGALLTVGARSYNYLDPTEGDKDLRSYQSALRLSRRLPADMSVFAQPFVVYRDFLRRVDFGGADRDATTYGALFGLARTVGILRGRLGIGLFRFAPNAAILPAFTGFTANGEISWAPRRRTLVTAAIASGDAATVRAGATGRQDTTISLRLDQEVRHNLLVDGGVGWERVHYRNAANADRDTLRFQGGATFLLNRIISVYVQGTITRRDATTRLNSFDRDTLTIGIRLRR